MTKEVKIKDIIIGGGHPVAIQSMTTFTDTEKIIKQIHSLEELGCEIIRISVFDENSAQAIKAIKPRINIPLVADIHFNHILAIKSIENGVDKIRINPGNIGSDCKVKALVDCAKQHHIPIRIGVNSGSLPKDILASDGNTIVAMIKSADRHIKLLEKFSFDNIVVSLKSSDVNKTIEACIAFDKIYQYPQHIGVTESGGDRTGLIRSAIGIGSLLRIGIGDTMRVSLSNAPEEEVLAAWDILNAVGLRKRGLEIISCPTCARHGIDVESIARQLKKRYQKETRYFKVAVMGCVVNGPGEAAECDIGIAGGKEYSLLFKNGKKFKKLKSDEALDALIKEIDLMLKK